MNELTDAEFCSWLDKLQAGETVPERLAADDAADLALASRLFERQFTPSAAPLALAQLMSPNAQAHLPVISSDRPLSARWRVVLSLASLAAVLIVLTLVYPPAWAMAEQVIQKIIVGKITVVIEETTTVAPTPEQPPADNYSTIWTPASLAEVQAKYPDLAHVPGWTPAGYVFQERVAVHFGQGSDTVPAHVVFEWRNSQGNELQLMVISSNCSHAGSLDPTADCFKMFVYTDATHQPRSIQVNGQTAAIMTGGPWWPDYSGPARVWNPTHFRSNPGGENGLGLTWEKGPNEYLLAASSGDISEKDLIRTAESIP